MATGVLEVGGGGTLGIAFEETLGTYVAPTKWIPIRSETLQLMSPPVYLNKLRGVAGRSGSIPGYKHIAGDIVVELAPDIAPYFFYAMRVAPVKTGVSAPFTYVFTPVNDAKTFTGASDEERKTLSITVQRSQIAQGYVGCSISQVAFSFDAGELIATFSIIGTDEEDETYDSSFDFDPHDPFGPGEVTFEIPDGTTRTDSDSMSLTINDNATPAFRLNGSRGAAYVNWAEREITATMEHDFENDDDFQAFVDQEQQTLTLTATNSEGISPVAGSVEIDLAAIVTDSYAVNLSGLGDIVRGTVNYHGLEGDAGDAYTITAISNEDIGGT
jgi:hypothetical protein